MQPFRLFWVWTVGQYDDGFVVARHAITAAKFVSGENFVFAKGWARAEPICEIPGDWQTPEKAVRHTELEPSRVHWATAELLAACGVRIVHERSPRVFYFGERLFTEGVFDYHREMIAPLEPLVVA